MKNLAVYFIVSYYWGISPTMQATTKMCKKMDENHKTKLAQNKKDAPKPAVQVAKTPEADKKDTPKIPVVA